jgi:elongation factor G
LEILRDRIEIEYGIRAELGKMRVAYRESVGKSVQGELVLDKQIGGQNMYAKIKLEIESTLDDYDM